MVELRGKGWRVLGYFFWMLGAGIVLDASSHGFGRFLLLFGGGLFALGVWQSSRPNGTSDASRSSGATRASRPDGPAGLGDASEETGSRGGPGGTGSGGGTEVPGR